MNKLNITKIFSDYIKVLGVISGSIIIKEWMHKHDPATAKQIANEVKPLIAEIQESATNNIQTNSGITTSALDLRDHINKFENFTDKFFKVISENSESKNYIGDIKLGELYQDFQAYTSTLSLQELAILFNLSGIIFIMGCLLSIIFTFYGDLILNKLNLEKKFPKLAGLIKLRRSFVQFYLLINILFIILALIIMTYINVVTLLN